MTVFRHLTGWPLLILPLAGYLIFLLVARPDKAETAPVTAGGSAHLTVTVFDDVTGQRTPARARLTDASGKPMPAPGMAVAIMYGREPRFGAEGYAAQPDGSFYVDGSFVVELPAGEYRLAVSKGYEFLSQEYPITLKPGQRLNREFRLQRWINMPARGWYSADDHIHLRRSPRENPLILTWLAAEDVQVGVLLQVGDFWGTYFHQYAWGNAGNYQFDGRLLTAGQEDPRTHEVGHTLSFGADAFVRSPNNYYLYDRVFDEVRRRGGLSGYAHQAMSFHGYRGLTLDLLRKKVDFLELLQFCVGDGPLHVQHYYHFLDLGFKLTATAGSDFPYCGIGPRFGEPGPQPNPRIGNARFYTYVGKEFGFERWREAVRDGHTFVSSGPILELEVNGQIAGTELAVAPGTKLAVTARAWGHARQVPLENLEIVVHSQVVRTVTAQDPGQTPEHLSIQFELPAEKGFWIAARCQAGRLQLAHTTPVYVTVNGGGFHNPRTAPENLELCEAYLKELEEVVRQPDQRPEYQAWRYRKEIDARIAQAREVLAALRTKLANP
jgi:hypothetical protein